MWVSDTKCEVNIERPLQLSVPSNEETDETLNLQHSHPALRVIFRLLLPFSALLIIFLEIS